MPVTLQMAGVSFHLSPLDTHSIDVFATASFQNGANTITIPDLSVLSAPFFRCCSSGQAGTWSAAVYGATVPLSTSFPVFATPTPLLRDPPPGIPPDAFFGVVDNTGFFIAP
jgi:hypothetical protein